MAEVLMFPQKKVMSMSTKNKFDNIAKDYVEVLKELIVELDVDITNQSEYMDVLLMVQETVISGIITAVFEEEGL